MDDHRPQLELDGDDSLGRHDHHRHPATDPATRNVMVSIVWKDAESQGGPTWEDRTEMLEFAQRPLTTVHTVGLLLHADDEQIAITDTKGPEEMGSVTKIPRIWLKRFDRLGPISSKLEDASSGSPARRSLHPESRAG